MPVEYIQYTFVKTMCSCIVQERVQYQTDFSILNIWIYVYCICDIYVRINIHMMFVIVWQSIILMLLEDRSPAESAERWTNLICHYWFVPFYWQRTYLFGFHNSTLCFQKSFSNLGGYADFPRSKLPYIRQWYQLQLLFIRLLWPTDFEEHVWNLTSCSSGMVMLRAY